MEKINIEELLKDCPKGMELDCTVYDSVQLNAITEGHIYPIDIQTPEGIISLSKYGCYSLNSQAKCGIFPKGKTSWEGFQRPFKDGDILTTNLGSIFILKTPDINNFCYGCYVALNDVHRLIINNPRFCVKSGIRFATEEEKQKLFKAIKDNGYKWNFETKTLEKLIVPKFKVGDKVKDKYVNKDDCASEWKIINVNNDTYTVDCSHSISFENQDNYELIINNQPKFKVGDRIRHKDDKNKTLITITGIKADYYFIQFYNIRKNNYQSGKVSFKDQDKYELVPNKFDITTLKPFDKVLVRDSNSSHFWEPKFFFRYEAGSDYPYRMLNYQYFNMCIPYESNEHLLGTTNDCDEYYKTWE